MVLQNAYNLDDKILYLAVGLTGMLMLTLAFCIYWRVKRKKTYSKVEMVSDTSDDEAEVTSE